MREAGDNPRPQADGAAGPRPHVGRQGSTAPQGSGRAPQPPSWRALITGLVALTHVRPLWWRGARKRRALISPEEEGGIAAVPPA
ncbi:hypothetical protein ABZY45_11475 [Streptomyces sp. NPDC006516]|uniref:hypothetical protein n=1 Tax=Streptomyces sp. NPDC006516 TaxID=3154309 RepID=UPI0033BB8F9E